MGREKRRELISPSGPLRRSSRARTPKSSARRLRSAPLRFYCSMVAMPRRSVSGYLPY